MTAVTVTSTAGLVSVPASLTAAAIVVGVAIAVGTMLDRSRERARRASAKGDQLNRSFTESVIHGITHLHSATEGLYYAK